MRVRNVFFLIVEKHVIHLIANSHDVKLFRVDYSIKMWNINIYCSGIGLVFVHYLMQFLIYPMQTALMQFLVDNILTISEPTIT